MRARRLGCGDHGDTGPAGSALSTVSAGPASPASPGDTAGSGILVKPSPTASNRGAAAATSRFSVPSASAPSSSTRSAVSEAGNPPNSMSNGTNRAVPAPTDGAPASCHALANPGAPDPQPFHQGAQPGLVDVLTAGGAQVRDRVGVERDVHRAQPFERGVHFWGRPVRRTHLGDPVRQRVGHRAQFGIGPLHLIGATATSDHRSDPLRSGQIRHRDRAARADEQHLVAQFLTGQHRIPDTTGQSPGSTRTTAGTSDGAGIPSRSQSSLSSPIDFDQL